MLCAKYMQSLGAKVNALVHPSFSLLPILCHVTEHVTQSPDQTRDQVCGQTCDPARTRIQNQRAGEERPDQD